MTERGWVTLTVRLLGLWLLVTGGAGAVAFLVMVSWTLLTGSPTAAGFSGLSVLDSPYFLIQSLPAIRRLLAGLYLLFRADGLINSICRQIVWRCPGCGYDVRGCSAEACPECNAPLRGRGWAHEGKAA